MMRGRSYGYLAWSFGLLASCGPNVSLGAHESAEGEGTSTEQVPGDSTPEPGSVETPDQGGGTKGPETQPTGMPDSNGAGEAPCRDGQECPPSVNTPPGEGDPGPGEADGDLNSADAGPGDGGRGGADNAGQPGEAPTPGTGDNTSMKDSDKPCGSGEACGGAGGA